METNGNDGWIEKNIHTPHFLSVTGTEQIFQIFSMMNEFKYQNK